MASQGGEDKRLRIATNATRSELDKIQADRAEELQRDIFVEALEVIEDSLAFWELEGSETEPPELWVRKLGRKAALRKFRVAMAAGLKPSEAPIALRMASHAALGIIKTKAAEKTVHNQLNVAIMMPAADTPAQELPEMVIEDGK